MGCDPPLATEKGHPVSRAPLLHQNNRPRKTIHEAKCNLHPRAKRYVDPFSWLASIVSNTVIRVILYLRVSLDEPNTAHKTSIGNFWVFKQPPGGPHTLRLFVVEIKVGGPPANVNPSPCRFLGRRAFLEKICFGNRI